MKDKTLVMWGTVEGWPQPQNLLGGPANLAAPDFWGGKHCEEPLETMNTLEFGDEARQEMARLWTASTWVLPNHRAPTVLSA